MSPLHREVHAAGRIGWLRAAVLGANDGVISISGLIVGVASSGAAPGSILLTGVAGLAAGALSMAAGEYVSVQSQADTERADLVIETAELRDEPERELAELAGIYQERGLDRDLALRVAEQLMAKDALGAHARDELGITETLRARPLQASAASAASFVVGALLPVGASLLAPEAYVIEVVIAVTLAGLLLLGGTAARAGHAPVARGALRVVFWGALAMAVGWAVGRFFGVAA